MLLLLLLLLLQLLGLMEAAVSSGRAPWVVGRAPASDCCCCCLPLLLRSDDRDATIFLYYPVCRRLAPLNPHEVRPHLCVGSVSIDRQGSEVACRCAFGPPLDMIEALGVRI